MSSQAHREGRPDLVFILCDQLRADFLSAYGCEAIPTPNIDQLAAEGLVYDNALSPYPLCVPARASMLTGLNPLESGVMSNHHWLRPDRQDAGIESWSDRLRHLGYRTSSFGKMHFHPWESCEGFDDRIVSEDKRWPGVHDDYAEFLAQHGLEKFDATTVSGYQEVKGAITFPWSRELTTDRFVANETAEYIRRQPKGRSLAMMVGFPGPHCPYDPCPESLERVDASRLPDPLPAIEDGSAARARYREQFVEIHKAAWHAINYSDFTVDEQKHIRHHYAALIAQIDDELGRILDALKETGRYDNSVIIFTSDHGDHVGDQGRVGKGTFYEPSIHIPMIARLPGGKERGRIQQPVELSQVPATLLACGGDESTWGYRPLSQVAHGKPEPEVPIFGVLDVGVMVRLGDWKLTRYQIGFSELFNLAEDPQECCNLWDAPAHRATRDTMAALLDKWLLESALKGHGDKLLKQDQPLSRSLNFGRRGWHRIYPQPLSQ